MKCLHENSKVPNTSKRVRGRVGYTERYHYYVMRRRVCNDCGHAFTTVEVDRVFLENLMNVVDGGKKLILQELSAYLESKINE